MLLVVFYVVLVGLQHNYPLMCPGIPPTTLNQPLIFSIVNILS